MQKLRKIIEL